MASAARTIFFDLGDTLVKTGRVWLPGAQSLLTALAQGGFRLGIISNTNGLTDRQAILDILPEDFDLNIFDLSLILFSSEVQIEKPNKKIFQKAVTSANVPANECLYCSENMVETLVAQHVGMRSIRVQTAPNSDLASLPRAILEFHALAID